MTGTIGWENATNILCIRLDTLGDVLMSTPAIRALRESRPGRKITLLTSPAGAAIAALVPEIDDVMVYDAPWMKATAPRTSSAAEYEMADLLRARKFDAAVIFTVYSQNPLPAAFLCYMADIPLRLAHCHENPYQLLTDWVKDHEPEQMIRHEVQRQLDLVEWVGCRTEDQRLSLQVPDATWSSAIQKLVAVGLDLDRPWTAVHPGASAASRRYPPDSFAAATRSLVEDLGLQVLFTGDASECELVEEIRAAAGVSTYSLAGELNLGELAAVIALASLMISNNTGPMHVAAAVGTPVVALYALTNPQHTPWEVPNRVLFHDVPCKWCYKSTCPLGHHDCLRKVAPARLVAAASELLGTRMRPRAPVINAPKMETML